MIFYCENTGVEVDVRVNNCNDLKINDRVFSSELTKMRHVRTEENVGCRLAHSNCFVYGDKNKDSVIVWCKHKASLYPCRYYIVTGLNMFMKILANAGLIPFVVVPEGFSDKAIEIASCDVDMKGDPFENAALCASMVKHGKTVEGNYKPLTETDVANMVGIKQSAVHAMLQLNHANPVVKKAYYDGLNISRVMAICRLPEEEQESFLSISKVTSFVPELYNKVSDRLAELGIVCGRSGLKRNRGDRQVGRKKLRKLEELILAEKAMQKVYNDRLLNSDVGPDTLVYRGIIQGLKYAMSMGDLPKIGK